MENENTYSIQETANILGVTRQSIYNYIEDLKSKDYISISKNNHSMRISEDGLTYLKELFEKKGKVNTVYITNTEKQEELPEKLNDNEIIINSKVMELGYQVLSNQLQILQEQNSIKDNLIIEKDKRIAELTDKIAQFTSDILTLPEGKDNKKHNKNNFIKNIFKINKK